MTEATRQRLETMVQRHADLMEDLKSGGGNSSPSFSHELSKLSRVVALQETMTSLQDEEASILELLHEVSADEDMKQECEDELESIREQSKVNEEQILEAILPQDQDDLDSDAMVFVAAGSGGDEASLFAKELANAYINTAKQLRWKVEIMSRSQTDIGGAREVTFVVSGRSKEVAFNETETELGPYGFFKYESGVHRVQRVPINDSRIHTSACSVAVMPAQDDTSEEIPMSDLKIETMRASGAGGQHVNTTDSAVRITHVPTGITAAIQDERSQHENRKKALKLIATRVRDQKRAEEEKERGETLSNLMGGGDRSERIRTYNYPQDRVTDHRCKESKTGIANLFSGSDTGLVSSFLPFLRALRREQLLNDLEKEGLS